METVCRICFIMNMVVLLVLEGFSASPVTVQYGDIGKSIQMTCPDKRVNWQNLITKDILASCETGTAVLAENLFNKIKVSDDCHNLTINDFQKEDVGRYRCYIISRQANNHMYDFEIKSRSVTIVEANFSNIIKRLEGEIVTLTCLIQGPQPISNVYWTSRGKVLAINESSYVRYQFKAEPIDHMSQFVCMANSSQDKHSFGARVQLSLIFKPQVKVVSYPNPPIVRKGQDIKLQCKEESVNVGINNSFSWKHNRHFLQNDTSTLQFVRVYLDVAGDYNCTIKNIAGEGSDGVKVTVTYPPVLQNYTVAFKTNDVHVPSTIQCKASGVPNTYAFSGWRHYTYNDQLVRVLNGYENGTLTLPHHVHSQFYDQNKLTYEDSGIYVCNVTNNIGDEHGHLWHAGKVEVVIESIPVLVKPIIYSHIGYFDETSSVSIFVLSSSNDTKAYWFDERQMPLNTSTCSPCVTNTDLFGKPFKVPSYRCVFLIQTTTKDDFQNYTVHIENKFGKNVFNFSLVSASQPEEPTNISCQSRTNHIHVEFLPGFDGGSPQKLIIEYRKASSMTWIQLEIGVSLNHYAIKNLEPSTEYVLQMYASNKLGNSSFTSSCFILTKDEISSSGTKYIGIVLALTFTVCILVIWWRLRKAKRNNSQRFRANDQQIQGLGVIANNIFGSAVDLNGPLSESAYASAGRTDVYSSIVRQKENVDKHEVTYKIAEPGQKKIQLTDRKGRKRHTKGGSLKLNYIDVVFEPQAHSGKLYIHGADKRTPYADIDFSAKAEPLSSSDEDEESSIKENDNSDKFVFLEDVQQLNII